MPTPAASELAPGTLVGEYQITHKLGEGGMGVVYAGVHPEIGKHVAIKVLAQHAAERPDLISRFKEEARAVNKIRHPNIIDIFAFNQLPDRRHYFVMEYLDGESLTARLERGPFEPAELRRLLAQICNALEAAHKAGVIHRDLKPDNIYIATESLSEPSIKLLDFGIAKLADRGDLQATQAGVAMGTPHYMPPEQGLGRTVDARTDVYALGVILYQIFAGTVPFDGVTAHEIIMKHVNEAPLPPSRHRPIVPAGMEAIILACLQKPPERRPQTMKELGVRIDAVFAATAPVSTRAPTFAAPVPDAARASVATAPTSAPTLAIDAGAAPPPIGSPTTLGAMTGDLGLEIPKRSRRPLAVALAALAVAGGFVVSLIGRRSGSEVGDVPATEAADAAAAGSPAAPPSAMHPRQGAPTPPRIQPCRPRHPRPRRPHRARPSLPPPLRRRAGIPGPRPQPRPVPTAARPATGARCAAGRAFAAASTATISPSASSAVAAASEIRASPRRPPTGRSAAVRRVALPCVASLCCASRRFAVRRIARIARLGSRRSHRSHRSRRSHRFARLPRPSRPCTLCRLRAFSGAWAAITFEKAAHAPEKATCGGCGWDETLPSYPHVTGAGPGRRAIRKGSKAEPN